VRAPVSRDNGDMADLIGGLEKAIRARCVDAMRDHSDADLNALGTRSLVADYAAWRALFPSSRPRSVHDSDAMAVSPLLARYADGLAAIRRDIAAGADLTRYLSSRVRSADIRDLLLAHAGIHHLHMSDTIESWGRVERTEHVLFVAFRPDAAYLIDVYAHQSDGANWAEQAILKTIVRNWPEAGILRASRFATGLTQRFDDETRKELRSAGVNLAIEIGDRVWWSAGAAATGAPHLAARMGMKVVACLDALRAAGLTDLMAGLAEASSPAEVSAGEWVPMVHEEHYGFYADSINLFVRYGPLLAE
jgi:hypothetical protein